MQDMEKRILKLEFQMGQLESLLSRGCQAGEIRLDGLRSLGDFGADPQVY
jgi:hypothetical protein